jgi:ubiquinone/menaquinone biosynthesis C-methylase UbiE
MLSNKIEPNLDMRKFGELQLPKVTWLEGSAENTNLNAESVDWVSMASSFHWSDPNKSLPEFARILRKDGVFTALWNPRIITGNLMLEEIENYIYFLNPNIKRVSSGNSGITNRLESLLLKSGSFENVCYSEASHTIMMTKERYIGAWNSVNDLQVQLGEENFHRFIQFVEKTIGQIEVIETRYLTRAWSARVKK